MIHREKLPLELLNFLDEQKEIDFSRLEMPPAVFLAMKGEIMSIDLNNSLLQCRFPVLNEQLNPYGTMQGGMISAAIDNTIGPLSMTVAAPNVTRKLEIKYLNPIDKNIDFIYIKASFLAKKKRFLYFEASVQDAEGSIIYALAKATHWIV